MNSILERVLRMVRARGHDGSGRDHPEGHSKIRVLFSDDCAEIRALMRMALEPRGITVFEAVGHNDTIEAITTCRPHLVLTDVQKGGECRMGSFDGLVAVLTAADERSIPVIIQSAHPAHLARSRVPEELPYHYLQKPYDVAALVKLIVKLLKDRGMDI